MCPESCHSRPQHQVLQRGHGYRKRLLWLSETGGLSQRWMQGHSVGCSPCWLPPPRFCHKTRWVSRASTFPQGTVIMCLPLTLLPRGPWLRAPSAPACLTPIGGLESRPQSYCRTNLLFQKHTHPLFHPQTKLWPRCPRTSDHMRTSGPVALQPAPVLACAAVGGGAWSPTTGN